MDESSFVFRVDLDGVVADFYSGLQPIAADWLGVSTLYRLRSPMACRNGGWIRHLEGTKRCTSSRLLNETFLHLCIQSRVRPLRSGDCRRLTFAFESSPIGSSSSTATSKPFSRPSSLWIITTLPIGICASCATSRLLVHIFTSMTHLRTS